MQPDAQNERSQFRAPAVLRRAAGGALRAWSTSALVAAVGGLAIELLQALGGLNMAADPTSQGAGLYVGGALGAALLAALGPQWLVILSTIGAAAWGAAAQASRRKTSGLPEVLRIVALWGGGSLSLTAAAVWLLQSRAGITAPAAVLYPAVAFGLAAVGDIGLARARQVLTAWKRPVERGGERDL